MEENLNKEMLKRLDAIIFLLLEMKDKDGKASVKDKVKLLNDVGFGYNQIAKVLGKSPGNIAVQLNILKKEEEKNKEMVQKEAEPSQLAKGDDALKDGN